MLFKKCFDAYFCTEFERLYGDNPVRDMFHRFCDDSNSCDVVVPSTYYCR